MKVNISKEDCEPKKFPQGIIYLGPSSSEQSVGFLRLFPSQQLDKHNRPIDEQLKQLEGSCVMKLFDGDKLLEEKKLATGDELLIPANQYHIHTNPFDEESVTYWQFDSNITEVIESIRRAGE